MTYRMLHVAARRQTHSYGTHSQHFTHNNNCLDDLVSIVLFRTMCCANFRGAHSGFVCINPPRRCLPKFPYLHIPETRLKKGVVIYAEKDSVEHCLCRTASLVHG